MVQEVEDLIGEMEKAFVSVDGHCVLEKGLSEEAEDVFYKERNLAGWKKDVLECNFMIQSDPQAIDDNNKPFNSQHHHLTSIVKQQR
ncbi:hypothetical protein JHK84_043822 [Glycine max]|nr:hypothetical protein JHK84_043822 [Glycine max]